jgi:ribosomal protein L18
MYAELEEHFQELLTKLQNGEIAYIDDARLWANYFPERAEQKARKKMVTNAVVGGVGENIGSAVESILEGAKDIIDRTIDAIDN